MLVFAVLLLLGLGVVADDPAAPVLGPDHPVPGDDGARRTVVEIGGLARTDRAGYGEEFDRLRAELLAIAGTTRCRGRG